MFDTRNDESTRYGRAREELRALLRPDEYAAAQRSTVNAHYTDPAYVTAIWDAVRALGFNGGTVLEPGCGIGNFFSGAPQAAKLLGVELDPITAAMARAVHPRAEVRSESFADTRLAEGLLDLVVGNVPFGDFALLDPRHNAKRHRIHNHFLIKSLHLMRPGAVLVAVTSRYTLDSTNTTARLDMAELADFLGAVRLPTGAHRAHAGTDVVTDILVFRRREDGRAPAPANAQFVQTVEFAEGLHLNAYFAERPSQVLGELFVDQGERGRAELGVRASEEVKVDLARALELVTRGALERDLGFKKLEVESEVLRVTPAPQHGEYSLTALPDGTFTERREGRDVEYRPPAAQAAELRLLLELRDTLTSLLEVEAASIGATAEVTAVRDKLNATYDRYAKKYGALNRFSARRTGRTDESGEPILARVRPPQGGFRQDPMSSAVYALERFHEETQRADKASIFKERVLQRQPVRVQVETPAEALHVSLDRSGRIDLVHIGELLRLSSEDEARAALGDLVFTDPETGELVTRAEYLSGNVREKLAAAKVAALHAPQYEDNVNALQEALPADIDPADIRVNFGAAWIDPEYVQDFLRTLLNDRTVVVEQGVGAMWTIDGQAGTIEATDTWGTPQRDALDIVQALCEQKPIRVYDHEGALHQAHTAAAIAKAAAIEAEFRAWIWQDTARTEKLVTKYNALFNSYVRRTYDTSEMTLPGLAVSFRPHDYQLEGVAHCLAEPRVGLFHDVGLGKTATMVMATMKAKALDPTRKVGVVVPNHMLEQFSREWLQMYPQARVLAIGTDDLSSQERRRMFIAKCSLSNWDAVILTMAAFEKIATRDTQKLYMEEQLDALDKELDQHRDRRSDMTVKRLEKMKIRLEEKYKELLKTVKDDGLVFERTGINALVVDELHLFKNLMTPSAIQGIAISGSNRATDLHLKLWLLEREQGSRQRRGLFIGATATPLSNNIIENYVILRYLAPVAVKRVGIASADQFVATFTAKKTAVEVSPVGEMRMKERIAEYVNVPELRGLWAPFANLRRADQTSLNLPQLRTRERDGRRAPEVVVVQPTAALKLFMAELAERAERIRSRKVDPKDDNHLKLASDGRRVAQDFRLLDPAAAVGVQKVDVASGRIADIFHATRRNTYLAEDGEEHPRAGALQIVFADLGTPRDDGAWSLYEEFRAQLAELGVPVEQVRFVHEAKNDKQKAELFRACREGEVAVLVGSTEKMGVGTNIQARAVALHHIDVPYRPSDVTQREGRILRQGNQNPEVQIIRYVTEGSFDGYVWQLVTAKNEHQQGFLNWAASDRTMAVGAVDEVQLSLQEIKALATGNPLLMEHAECLAEVKRLHALEQAHTNSQRYRESRSASARSRITHAEQSIERVSAAITQLPNGEIVVGDTFQVEVEGKQYVEQAPANRALLHAVALLRNRYIVRWKTEGRNEGALELTTRVGKLGPYDVVVASPRVAQDAVVIRLEGVPSDSVELSSREELARLNEGSLQLVQRLLNQVRRLPERLQASRLDLKAAQSELARVQTSVGATEFPHAAELLTRRLRLEEIERELASGAMRAAEMKAQPDFRSMPEHERDGYIAAVVAEYEEKHARCVQRITRFASQWQARAERRCHAALAALRDAPLASADNTLHVALDFANEHLVSARSFANDVDGRLTKRVERTLQRAHGPLAKLREEIRGWQLLDSDKPVADDREGTALDDTLTPVERWQAALTATENAIAESAQLACKRIEDRRSTLKQKLQVHRAARPKKLFNATAFQAWVKRDDQIQKRLTELTATAVRVRALLAEESNVLHSSRRALAVRRLQRLQPELVSELTAHHMGAARKLGLSSHEHYASRAR